MFPSSNILWVIAFGSNLYSRRGGSALMIEKAMQSLSERGLVIRARSRDFNTPAFPKGAGPDFVNGAALIEARMGAHEVLAHLHSVEAEMGRTREVRWGARTLDLDLIAGGALLLPDAKTHAYWRDLPLEVQKTTAPAELILPHPRLSERAFVLVPMLEVAPDWRHPATGHSVQEMHDALPQALRDEVVAL